MSLSIADLEKNVQDAKDNLAYAERMLAEEKAGFKALDARDYELRVTYLDKYNQTHVSVANEDGELHTINLNPLQTQGLYHYLARKLGFNK